MKNFFIPELSISQKKKLNEAGINHLPFSAIGDGVLIEDGDLELALKVLEKKIDTQLNTSYEGVFRLSLSTHKTTDTSPPLPPVKVMSWNGENRSQFIQATRDHLLSNLKTKKTVQVHVPHRKILSPFTDDLYHVIIWSSPKEGKTLKPPVKIFGVPTKCRDQAHQPSNQGYIVFDTETNYSPAEIVGQNIYIHHDICHDGADEELRLYRLIMKEAARILNLAPKERKQAEADRKTELSQVKRNSYIKICAGRFEKELTEVSIQVHRLRKETAQLEQQLLQKIRDGRFFEARLGRMQLDKQEAMTVYGQEYDRLLEHPQIIETDFDSESLIVFTNTILCLDSRTNYVHEIGDFKINLYFTPKEGSHCIRWTNLTRTQVWDRGEDKWFEGHAPHIFSSGYACMGNYQKEFPRLIANLEMATAAIMAIRFPESANVNDAYGKKIKYWPLAKKRDIERYRRDGINQFKGVKN